MLLQHLAQDAPAHQTQDLPRIQMDQGMRRVLIACQIVHLILCQAALMYLSPVILAVLNGMDNLDHMNVVMAENLAIPDKGILESPVIRVTLEKLGNLEMVARIEITANNGISETPDQPRQVDWNVHENIKIAGHQKIPANHPELTYLLVVTSTSENEVRERVGVDDSTSTAVSTIHPLQHHR